MNRRNFILGLGTAATLSGAASVTGAAITNSVEPGADFRVVSDQTLTVRRNYDIPTTSGDEIDNSTAGYLNTSDPEVNTRGDIDFSGSSADLADYGGPQMTIDNSSNNDLNMSLATPNDATIESNQNETESSDDGYYNTDSGYPPLQVVNNGSGDQQFGVTYGYGDDATSAGIEDTVAQLFTFEIDSNSANQVGSDTQISPTPSDTTNEANTVTIEAGETVKVDLILNYSESIESTLAEQFSGGSFGGTDVQNVNLLDTVQFGVDDN